MTFKRLQLFIILFAATLQAAEEPVKSPAPNAKPLHFIIDFLPAAIYDRDGVSANFRIENTSDSAIKLDFVASSFDSAGTASVDKTESLSAAPKAFTACQSAQNASGRSRFKFALRHGAQTVAEVNVRLLRDDDVWPATRIRNGRLEASDSGEILIPTVTRRSKNKDRAFAPMKWLLKAEKPENPGNAVKGLFIVPAQWPLQNAPEGATLSVLHKIDPTPAPPILVFADQVIQKLSKIQPPAEGASLDQNFVLVLPPDDLETATDPWIYRIVLDAMLARATSLRFKKIVIVPAFHFGAKEKHFMMLAGEVREAAAVYAVTSVDPAEFLNEQLWRVDPEQAGIYGRLPNAEGLKKIQQGLWNLVR